MSIRLTSSAFLNCESIPRDFTGDGQNMSPPLAWSGIPANTRSIAVIADDPDAPRGTWVHWVIYNIPPEATSITLNVPTSETLPNGAQQGINDFRQVGYGGPCPPPGKPHRYLFRIYALDTVLQLKGKATKQALVDAMRGHILDEGQLMGMYAR